MWLDDKKTRKLSCTAFPQTVLRFSAFLPEGVHWTVSLETRGEKGRESEGGAERRQRAAHKRGGYQSNSPRVSSSARKMDVRTPPRARAETGVGGLLQAESAGFLHGGDQLLVEHGEGGVRRQVQTVEAGVSPAETPDISETHQ